MGLRSQRPRVRIAPGAPLRIQAVSCKKLTAFFNLPRPLSVGMVPTDSVLAHFVITLKPQYFHCIHHDTPEFFFCEDMYAIFIFYFINSQFKFSAKSSTLTYNLLLSQESGNHLPAEGENSHKRSGSSTAQLVSANWRVVVNNPPKGQVAPATKTLR